VPIDHAQDSALLSVYCKVANTADQLVDQLGALRPASDELVDAACESFRDASPHDLPDSRVYTLPEAVAQVACYLKSLEAVQGVHGVVDIGAGTTDVSVFWLQQSRRGAERCTWYSALAIPHGTSLVYRA